MPSGNHDEYSRGPEESEFVFQGIIKPAVTDALGEDALIHREADRRVPGAITREIVRNTAVSDVVVVDITGQNPNVFFELGIRYALRPATTVLIRQEGTEIPFDINVYRCVEYSPYFFGPERSRREIARAITEAVNGCLERSDSLVFDVLPGLSVEFEGMPRQTRTQAPHATMPWSEYLEKIETVVSHLEPKFSSAKYRPDVLVAISNGGMAFADFLGMKQFLFGTPKVSLWADRLNKRGEYFDNAANNALISGIKEMRQTDRPQEVLLLDDIIASGTTVIQAVRYLTKNVPDARLGFLPLVSRNEQYLDVVREVLVWFREPFAYTDDDAQRIHATAHQRLPYGKEIRGA